MKKINDARKLADNSLKFWENIDGKENETEYVLAKTLNDMLDLLQPALVGVERANRAIRLIKSKTK